MGYGKNEEFDLEIEAQGNWRFGWMSAAKRHQTTCKGVPKIMFLNSAVMEQLQKHLNFPSLPVKFKVMDINNLFEN